MSAELHEHAGRVEHVTEPTLARGRISARQALFFGLTAIGIASVLSGTGASLAFSSGYSSWLAMLVGAVVALLLAAIVVRFSRRHLTTGSIMSYLALEVGPRAGVLGGAALFVGYIAVLILFLGLALVFLFSFLQGVGVALTSTPLQVLIGVVLVAICVILGRRGVSVSVNTAVVLGWLGVPFVIVILIGAVLRDGVHLAAQLDLHDFTLSGFITSFVLAFGIFAGFEGFTALAQETTDPRRTVPRLVTSVVVITAVLGLICVLLTVPIMTAHSKDILAGLSPLQVLADVAGLSWLGTIANALLFLATVGSLLAYINDAGRIFGTAARDGLLPKALGHIHETHRTPARAITFVSIVGVTVFAVYLLITGEPIYTAFITFALITSYSWSIAYIALAAAGIADGIRTRSIVFTISAVLAAGAVLFADIESFTAGSVTAPLVTIGLIAVLWIVGTVARHTPVNQSALETL